MAASSFFFIVFLALQSGHKKMLLLCNSWQLELYLWHICRKMLQLSGFDFSSIPFFGPFIFVFVFSCFHSHFTCFLLSVPVPWSGKGRGEAESISVSASTPWATQPCSQFVSDSLPAKPIPPFPLEPTDTSQAASCRCAVGMPFLRTIIYFLAVVEIPVQIHHNFQFYKNSCYYFLPVAHNLSLNSFCNKFLCEYGFNLF